MSERIYRQDGLSLVVNQSRGTAVVAWMGFSDGRNPSSFLNPVIAELADTLQRQEVTIDLRGLDYMNSATVGPLIAMVKRLDANGMPVRVLFSDNDWQRTHSNCMSAIARTLKHVKVELARRPAASF